MRLFFICSILIFSLLSCRTQKNVTQNYLQDVSDTTIREAMSFRQSVIQKGDILSIRVFSDAIGTSLADVPFNLEPLNTTGATGYLVDANGNIEYPQLGSIKAEGLTREQLSTAIKILLEGKLNRPAVDVRFLNYRITVLGEVRSPSTFTLPTERITILEALGLAGDISEFGKKDNVKIIRETDGQVEIGTIDLTSNNMFASPYFRLQQNDVVFVEQTGKKIKQQEQMVVAQQIGIATSIVTAIALIINLIR